MFFSEVFLLPWPPYGLVSETLSIVTLTLTAI